MYNLIIPGARFYNQLDAALTHNDIIEAELSKEIESARLFRLLTKLCTVVDRAELNGDFGWAEYGDRYMLKLFRDYIFHQVCSLFRLTFIRSTEENCQPILLVDCGTYDSSLIDGFEIVDDITTT